MASKSNPVPKNSMFLRHWLGEYPLAVALGRNDIYIKLSYFIFLAIFEVILTDGLISSRVELLWLQIYVQALFIILFVEAQMWGIVGVWRAAKASENFKRHKLTIQCYCFVSTSILVGVLIISHYDSVSYYFSPYGGGKLGALCPV